MSEAPKSKICRDSTESLRSSGNWLTLGRQGGKGSEDIVSLRLPPPLQGPKGFQHSCSRGRGSKTTVREGSRREQGSINNGSHARVNPPAQLAGSGRKLLALHPSLHLYNPHLQRNTNPGPPTGVRQRQMQSLDPRWVTFPTFHLDRRDLQTTICCRPGEAAMFTQPLVRFESMARGQLHRHFLFWSSHHLMKKVHWIGEKLRLSNRRAATQNYPGCLSDFSPFSSLCPAQKQIVKEQGEAMRRER